MLKVCMPKCSGRASLLVTSVVLYVSTAEPLFDWCLLGDSLTVELRTLTPPVVVRIHVPQPTLISRSIEHQIERRTQATL